MFGLVSLIDYAKPFIKRPPQSYNKHLRFEFNKIFERRSSGHNPEEKVKRIAATYARGPSSIKSFNINYYFMKFSLFCDFFLNANI